LIIALLLSTTLFGPADRTITLGDDGVLRWEDSGDEVTLFGVNTYPAFYAEYQEMKARGLDIRAEIESDLDQLARLGFDLIRVHCFDREFSTADGALVENERLALMDHLIAEAKARGIYTMLTPIAWWPTPGDEGGFSGHIPMADMIADPSTWPIQQRFLAEFVQHVNPETGLAYKDDPAIVAFETINEPIPPHGTPDEVVIGHINAHVAAIRGTGCTKPIFYNGWGGRLAAVAASEADGCTFGWYPTGLQSGGSLLGDCLSSVDRLDYAHDPVLEGLAKAVYEFDAADVASGVLYPAMARSFRAAGIQLAAQFQYDMTATAHHNAHWPTHFLNLFYAPQRAMAMMVASQAFHRLPRGGTYAAHPEGDQFGAFRVSHEENLTEMIAEDAFLYSADTQSAPPNMASLTLIAGVGSSPIVLYEGTGAYFVDRLEAGRWRLEVLPDAVWVDDPFSSRSINDETARVLHRERAMTLRLPDLGADFRATMAGREQAATDGRIVVTPGVWELRAVGLPAGEATAGLRLPPSSDRPATVRVPHPELLPSGRDWAVPTTVAAARDASDVMVGWDGGSVPARETGPYTYEATVPGTALVGETFAYWIEATVGGIRTRFPSGLPVESGAVAPPLSILSLDAAPPVRQGHDGVHATSRLVEDDETGERALELSLDSLENRTWVDVRIPVDLGDNDLSEYRALCLRLKRGQPVTRRIEVALAMGEEVGYGAVVDVPAEWEEVRLPLDRLSPLWQTNVPLDLDRVIALHVGYGTYTLPNSISGPHSVLLADAWLDPQPEREWRVPVLREGAPLVLFDGWPAGLRISGQPGILAGGCPGSEVGSLALRLTAPTGFPGNGSASAEIALARRLRFVQEEAATYRTLCLLVRSGEPRSTQVEVVLREHDRAAFGAEVDLTEQWRVVRLPLDELRHFGHWEGPANRGHEGDRLNPGRIASLHLTFGAWLYPDSPESAHAVEIGRVWLER